MDARLGPSGLDGPIVLVSEALRHTFSTRAAQHGMDLPTLAAFMEHSSIPCLRNCIRPMQDHKYPVVARFEHSRQKVREERLGVLELAC